MWQWNVARIFWPIYIEKNVTLHLKQCDTFHMKKNVTSQELYNSARYGKIVKSQHLSVHGKNNVWFF